MGIFYWKSDTSQFILEPNLTRWRSRYRGSRESWKQNLEIDQTGYDIHQLYNRTYSDEIVYEKDQYNIEFGINDSNSFGTGVIAYYNNNNTTFNNSGYTYNFGPGSASTQTSIDGFQDIIKRVQHLQYRVQMLESNGWAKS